MALKQVIIHDDDGKVVKEIIYSDAPTIPERKEEMKKAGPKKNPKSNTGLCTRELIPLNQTPMVINQNNIDEIFPPQTQKGSYRKNKTRLLQKQLRPLGPEIQQALMDNKVKDILKITYANRNNYTMWGFIKFCFKPLKLFIKLFTRYNPMSPKNIKKNIKKKYLKVSKKY